MHKLTESNQYVVFNEYETVMLKIKESQRMVQIGDFYGNPQSAIISRDERFCVMCGCGVIIYYLQEPFEEYEYDKKILQWKEWGRENSNQVWIENIECNDNDIIRIETENGEIFNIYAYEN